MTLCVPQPTAGPALPCPGVSTRGSAAPATGIRRSSRDPRHPGSIVSMRTSGRRRNHEIGGIVRRQGRPTAVERIRRRPRRFHERSPAQTSRSLRQQLRRGFPLSMLSPPLPRARSRLNTVPAHHGRERVIVAVGLPGGVTKRARPHPDRTCPTRREPRPRHEAWLVPTTAENERRMASRLCSKLRSGGSRSDHT